MKKFDCKCEDCKAKLGEASFEDSYSDEHCIERTTKGYLCESCAKIRQETGATSVVTIESLTQELEAIVALKEYFNTQITNLNAQLTELKDKK